MAKRKTLTKKGRKNRKTRKTPLILKMKGGEPFILKRVDKPDLTIDLTHSYKTLISNGRFKGFIDFKFKFLTEYDTYYEFLPNIESANSDDIENVSKKPEDLQKDLQKRLNKVFEKKLIENGIYKYKIFKHQNDVPISWATEHVGFRYGLYEKKQSATNTFWLFIQKIETTAETAERETSRQTAERETSRQIAERLRFGRFAAPYKPSRYGFKSGE
jgi:hypothetical protein